MNVIKCEMAWFILCIWHNKRVYSIGIYIWSIYVDDLSIINMLCVKCLFSLLYP